jgi:putative ABC transport system permease protein
MVGQALALAHDWKVGDRVPVGTTIWTKKDGTRTWEFTIDAIFTDGGTGANESALYFHYDYFDEARLRGAGLVGWYAIQVANPEGAESVALAIDDLFANSPAETKTTTEKGWVQGFAKQFGNIGLMVTSVMAAVFFTMLLVSGNTMAQSVRERTNELAVLKTLGFSDTRVLFMVVAESLLLSGLAGGLGLLMSVVMAEGMRQGLSQFLPGFGVSTSNIVLGVGLIIVLGVAAALVPALQAKRLNVVTALARR